MRTILVTGGNGQLGSEIQELQPFYTNYNFFFTDIAELDITDHIAVEKFVEANKINIIINCAAYTVVDNAEKDYERANAINHLSAKNFAQIAKTKKIELVHISTDYVFDGSSKKPYTEKDVPSPQSVYGRTKLDGENAILKRNPKNSVIIRTSWVYSSYGSNFVKTMLRLGKEGHELSVVGDQMGSPTYARDLAKTILEILPKIKNTGVELYHYTNEGACSWYDFAKTIFRIKGMPIKVNSIQTWQYPTPAKRPNYSVLDSSKIKNTFALDIRYWKDALEECLEKIGS
ncbi:dTDP-4-dehydrorhamnose reductase [Saonia flava]|uniref:dTDP-4-dehydrorhamnose reductase n=1 Tax=Saonia flava TaxID=523696 RepID=A0A846R0G5_9FLAO|nr:dTDP-4-dehydrorhamnose reductase [Saonia flava]NJB72650.1 dTDP-4-dehydrorhamnose reductase [Saonia flava]